MTRASASEGEVGPSPYSWLRQGHNRVKGHGLVRGAIPSRG